MRSALCGCLLLLSACVKAQVWDSLLLSDLRIDSTQTRTLSLKVDALTFFRDNEYDSDVAKGYSLPGAWVQPRVAYQPLPNVSVELGASALLFHGANKYPNYAYHDIATWKGNQYQRGAHVLPFLRAQADFRHLSIVMGNIHGAQHHQLITPLFNPEQNLSADPEMGFQLLLHRPHLDMDLWLNWQSYIFELDTHQEAFTVGLNLMPRWQGGAEALRWSTPIQLLLQHRGGEQDTIDSGVQTLVNASAGVRLDYAPRHAALNALRAEVNLLGSYQQSGMLWPFDTGFAAHAAVSAALWHRVGITLGHVAIPKQFANLYGNPFFSTLSIKHPGLTFRGMQTTYLQADYHYDFSPAYRLGAELEALHSSQSTVFSFGIYFRLSPTFVLKRFKGK